MIKQPIILLFGMPRSGTTWIGKIFDSHMRTLYRHEPDTWDKIKDIPLLENTENAEKYADFINEYVEQFILSRRPEINGKLPFFNKTYASPLRQTLFRGSVLLSGALSKLKKDFRLPVVRPVSSHHSTDFFVVWKSIQLLGRMGIIVNSLHNCKGVHILRHPCGYIASVLGGENDKKFTSFVPASEDYPLYDLLLNTKQAASYGLTMNVLKALTPEERLAWRWVLFNEKARDDTRDNKNVMILRYEDMCANPVKTAQSCFDFCGLELCEQTLGFLGASTSKDSGSYYSVYKDPKKAASKWRTVLGQEKIELIKSVIEKSSIGQRYMDDF